MNVSVDDVTVVDIIIKALPIGFRNFMSGWNMLDSDQQTLDELVTKLSEKANEVIIDEVARNNNNYSMQASVNRPPIRSQRGINNAYNTNLRGFSQEHWSNSRYPRLVNYHQLPRQKTNLPIQMAQRNYTPTTWQTRPDSQPSLCNYCNSLSHWKVDCYLLQQRQRENKQSTSRERAFASLEVIDDESPEIASNVIETIHADLSKTIPHCDKNTWLVDSGCSAHMRPIRAWIDKMMPTDKEINVKIVDGRLLGSCTV